MADITASSLGHQHLSSQVVVHEAKGLLCQGIDYARTHEPDRAIALFTQAIHARQSPPAVTVKSYYYRGCALCHLKQYTQAIADFTQVVEYNRALPLGAAALTAVRGVETYIHRGNAYRHLGQYRLALADLTRSVDLSGGSVQSYGCRGLLRLDMNDFGGAIADFDRALRMHPTFAQGYLWRGFARLRSGQPQQAAFDLTRAIKAIPTCAEAYNHRGVAYFYRHAFDAALADFDAAIRLDAQLVEAYNNRGSLRQLIGDRVGALADFDKAIALKPSLTELYFNRAAAFCAETTSQSDSNMAEMAADYEQTAGLSVYSAAFYRHRARVKAHQGHFREAIADYRAAISISPSAYAYYHRGVAYARLGERALARVDFDEAIALSPDYAAPYRDRAQVRFKTGDWEGAIADTDQFLALTASWREMSAQKTRREVYILRYLTHFCLGQKQQALADYEKLIDGLIQRGAQSSSSQTSKASTSIGAALSGD